MTKINFGTYTLTKLAKKGKTKMYLEKEKELKNLISIYRPDQQDAVLIGMATAMLTNEQADTMISYLEKWIEEKNV